MWNGVGIFFDSFDNDGKVNVPSALLPPLLHLLNEPSLMVRSILPVNISQVNSRKTPSYLSGHRLQCGGKSKC